MSAAAREGLPLGSEVTVEKSMKRLRRMKVRMEKAGQPRVPGPGRRMMEEAWWKEGVWTERAGGWKRVGRGWLEGRWKGAGMCLQPEQGGSKVDAAQTEDTSDSLLLCRCAGSAGGRTQRGTEEEGVRGKSR